MDKTWVLVANRSDARLFETKGLRGNGWRLVQSIPHPQGRLQGRDLESDKPGRTFDSLGKGRHAKSAEHGPVEQLAQQFARHLADLLNKGRNEHAYQKLVLVAEPGFLGKLLGALDDHTAALVAGTVKKDLIEIEDRDIPKHLENATL
ncbi:MAG: host attachment protein [Pseudomonadota bacterium]